MLNTKSKFGWGLVFGAVLGGAAAYFLSPKTGKENREMAQGKLKELKMLMKEKNVSEMAKLIFGKTSEEGQKLYVKARNELNGKLDELKAQNADMDYGKYKEIVVDVLSRLKEEKDATKDRLSKLQDYLLNRWESVQEMAMEDVKDATTEVKDTKTKKS